MFLITNFLLHYIDLPPENIEGQSKQYQTPTLKLFNKKILKIEIETKLKVKHGPRAFQKFSLKPIEKNSL